jgi:hypothetical protein
MQSVKPLPQALEVYEAISASKDITSEYRELDRKLDIVLEKIKKNKTNR